MLYVSVRTSKLMLLNFNRSSMVNSRKVVMVTFEFLPLEGSNVLFGLY